MSDKLKGMRVLKNADLFDDWKFQVKLDLEDEVAIGANVQFARSNLFGMICTRVSRH